MTRWGVEGNKWEAKKKGEKKEGMEGEADMYNGLKKCTGGAQNKRGGEKRD